MTTYHITEGPQGPWKRFRDPLFFTTVWLLGFSAFERLAYGYWDHPTVLAITGAIMFFGTLLTNSLWPPETPSFDLEIDDGEIRMVWNGEVIRKARKDRVRYVGERSGIFGTRLVISEHGTVGTRFLGCIRVPMRLLENEQYERIKVQALGWLDNSGR